MRTDAARHGCTHEHLGPPPRLRRGAGALFVVLVALLPWIAAVKADAAEPLKVVIGVSSRSFNPGYSNMWIGIPLGLYGPTLAPEAVGTQGASENLQLMLAGQVTMSTGVQDVVLNAMAEGRTLPVVAPCVYLRGMIHRLAVRPQSPVRSFADLTGKHIGVPTLAATQVPYVKFAAKAAGVDPASLRLVAVGDGQQAALALTGGRVDALAFTDVEAVRLQAAGFGLRLLPQPQAVADTAVAYVFAFARPWYAAHKDAAAALLQGMIKSIVVMLANPEAAVRISYQLHPEAIPAGIPFEQAVRTEVEAIEVRAPAIERRVGSSNTWCEFPAGAWQRYLALIGLAGKVDPMQLYTDELVSKVNAFDEAKLQDWARNLKVPKAEADYKDWLAGLRPPE
jgi:NitT/TauT family transport system substrate-binding protein